MSLKTLREKAGLSQHELGLRLHKKLHPGTEPPAYAQPRIAAYEHGRNAMSIPVAQALVAILNAALKKAGLAERATLQAIADTKKPRH